MYKPFRVSMPTFSARQTLHRHRKLPPQRGFPTPVNCLEQEAGIKPTFHNMLWFLSLKYSCRSPTKAVCGHCERKQLFSYSVYVQIIPSPCHRHHLKSKNLAAPRDWSTLVESNNPQPIYKTGPITAWVSVDIYNK